MIQTRASHKSFSWSRFGVSVLLENGTLETEAAVSLPASEYFPRRLLTMSIRSTFGRARSVRVTGIESQNLMLYAIRLAVEDS